MAILNNLTVYGNLYVNGTVTGRGMERPHGPQGPTGPVGPKGPCGPCGPRGLKGGSALVGMHEVSGSTYTLAWPSGAVVGDLHAVVNIGSSICTVTYNTGRGSTTTINVSSKMARLFVVGDTANGEMYPES